MLTINIWTKVNCRKSWELDELRMPPAIITKCAAEKFKNRKWHCTAAPRVKIISNLRRTHSEEEDEEKGEQGLPRAPICCSTTFPSPPLPPHTRTARLLDCLGLRYQDTSPPSKCIHTGQNQWFSGKAAKKYDSPFLETQEWHGWIRTAFVILHKLEWKW